MYKSFEVFFFNFKHLFINKKANLFSSFRETLNNFFLDFEVTTLFKLYYYIYLRY